MRTAIDFIAHHDIQAQAAQSIFEDLSRTFDCRWLVGADAKPSGAAAAVLIDHVFFQPRVRKSFFGYRALFHVLHDLADFQVYEDERSVLETCDLLLVPQRAHADAARKALGPKAPVHEIGWPKYDRMAIPSKHAAFEAKLNALPHDLTVLYTPTRAFTYEWRYLLPLLRDLPCNTILKNHIYVNPGQPMPVGCEEEYTVSMASADEMEAALAGYGAANMIVAPRTLNVCSLFPFADVAIADQSSVLAEFLPFGVSVETGRFNPEPDACAPEISRYFDEVTYLPKAALVSTLSSAERFVALARTRPSSKAPRDTDAGARAAALIRRSLEQTDHVLAWTRRELRLARADLSSMIRRKGRGLVRRVSERLW